MQKALCTTLLAAGVASADVLTIDVDGIADPAFGSFSGQLFLDTDTGALTGQTVLPQLFSSTIDFNGTFGGEGTSGETSQGSVTGPSYQGIGTLTVPFTGQFDWNFDVVFGSGVSLGDAGLAVVNLQGFDPINMGPLDANLSFNYSVVPAPGAIALLGLAGLGRRRRS